MQSRLKPITKDTHTLEPNGTYFCFTGSKVDGHAFINQAIEQGASSIYGTKAISDCDIYHQVDDINKTYVKMCQDYYHYDQTKAVNVIGITGTDGKTSTAQILTKMLNKVNKCAYLGTSGLEIDQQLVEYGGMTTPFAEDFYYYLELAYNAGCKYLVMEVSSHALAQDRLGTDFKFCGSIFTNLTPEHLDFHPTMQDYLESKLKLLDLTKEDGFVIMNADDKYFSKYASSEDVCSFSLHDNPANYQVEVLKDDLGGISFNLANTTFSAPLIGEFNIYNLSSAILAMIKLNYEPSSFIDVLKDLKVDGRMEVFNLENDNKVIVDFAHTPDSIKKVLSLLREQTSGNLIVVNGAAGERDETKRKTIGSYMDEFCDKIILTEDDPRSELVSDINNMLKSGITNLDKVSEIENRKEAISYALSLLNNHDVVVCLGKGGQSIQYFKDGPVDYCEQDVIKALLGGDDARY